MLPFILQGLTLGLSASFNPGPLLAFYMSRSVEQGWRRTLPAAFAPLVSDGPIIIVVLIVLTQMPDWVLTTLRFVGGGYILYLAWQSFRSLNKLDIDRTIKKSPYRNLGDAVLMNLVNPTAYIYWSTLLGPIIISAWRISRTYGWAFLASFYGVMIGGFIFLIVVVDLARHLGQRMVRTLGIFSALALAGFGLFQIGTGILDLIALLG